MGAQNTRDVRIGITSTFDDQGVKSAEASAKVFERELNRLEARQRKMAGLHAQAAREMAAEEAEKAEKIVAANRRQAEAMSQTGRAVLTVSTASAIGLGLTVKAAMDWESAWTGVTKTVDGSVSQMGQLEGQLRQLAKTLPSTHEEIAKVAENAGQLGVKRQDIASFTKVMIDMGQTTNLSADEASTAMAQFSNIMGLTASKASNLGSTIVALGNNGASTEADIMNLGLRVAAAGRMSGMTADQVLAIASALSSTGLEAEAGGTAISRVITQIDTDVRTGAKTIGDYGKVAGMTAQEFAAKWRADPAQALTSFISGLGRMQSQGQVTASVLDQLGFSDVRVADTLKRAALAGDLLTQSLDIGSTAWADNIALTQEAEKRYATAESKIQVAKNTIADAAITVGGTLMPSVADATQGVANLAEGFSTLPEPVQRWVTALGAGVTGLGLVVGSAAVAVPKLTELKDTVDALHGGSSKFGSAIGGVASFLTGPFSLALAAAGAGLTIWMAKQGEAKQRVDALREALEQSDVAARKVIASNLLNGSGFMGWAPSVAESAKTLGLNLGTVTDAITGNAAAIDKVNKATATAAMTNDQLRAAAEKAGVSTFDYGNAQKIVRDGIQQYTGDLSKAKDQNELLATATDQAASSTSGLASATSVIQETADHAADAIDDLKKALEKLNQPALDVSETEIAFQKAIDDASDSVEKNGRTLDLNTEKGRNNQSALNDMAKAASERAVAVLTQTGQEDQFRASLEQSRGALYDAAIQFGMSEDAAHAYVDQVLQVPAKTETQAIFNAVTADQQLTDFVARWRGTTVTVQAIMDTTGMDRAMSASAARYTALALAYAGASRQADGSVLSFAEGAENHVAQIAPAGAYRVWAERETGGEAYIPLAESKRARSEEILESVAGRFGKRVVQVAETPSGGAFGQVGSAGPLDLSVSSVRAIAAATAGAASSSSQAIALALQSGIDRSATNTRSTRSRSW